MSTTSQPAPQTTAAAAPPQPRNGMGTAALVLGIVGVVFAFVPFMWWLGCILGILATIFGFIGRGRVKRSQASNRGASLTGVITGLAAIVISTVMFVLFVAALGSAATSIDHSLNKTTTHGTVSNNGRVTTEKNQDYPFSHLRVSRDESFDSGTFKGTIVVRNTTGHQADIYVTVHAFNHNQNVGELDGNATLKPHSSSRINLTSVDNFTKTTDYTVNVDGM